MVKPPLRTKSIKTATVLQAVKDYQSRLKNPG